MEPPPAYVAAREKLQAANANLRSLVERSGVLQSQLTENEMVKQELDALKVDEPVYQLHGKVLVLQDHAEAKSLNSGRIALITSELKKVEAAITEAEKAQAALRKELLEMQAALQGQAQAQAQQQQIAAGGGRSRE